MVGRSRRLAFTYIKEKIWSRICNWKNKFLPQAGKEILIKAIAQLILTYTMSIFMLPKVLLREINGMMQNLRWSCYKQDSKIPWIRWEKMDIAKSRGGMGFCDLESFNKA